jgi:hypothetical protein
MKTLVSIFKAKPHKDRVDHVRIILSVSSTMPIHTLVSLYLVQFTQK